MQYLLHLRHAQKVATGIYEWTFRHSNTERCDSVEIGPVSVSTTTNTDEVVILSETFSRQAKQHTLRGDFLNDCVYVVHPEQKYSKSSTTNETTETGNTSGGEADVAALHASNDLILWLTPQDSNTTLTAGYVAVTALDDSSVKFWTNRVTDAPSNVYFATYQYLARASFGQTVALYGYNHSWNYTADSSNNPPWDQTRPWVYSQLWKAPATLEASYWINFR